MLLLVLVQFVIYFPVGYLLLSRRIKSFSFVEKISLCVALGLTVDMILLSIVGLIYVGYEVLVSITAISYAFLFLPGISKKIRNRKSSSAHKYDDKRSALSQKYLIDNVRNLFGSSRGAINLFVIILVVGHFSMVGDYMGWPPGVDAIKSGLLASLIKYNQKIGTDLSPLSPGEPWFEPFGFPIMSAYTSILFNIFPGESVLAFATVVMILILLLVYTAVYRLTGYQSLAVLALISAFYIYPITNDIRFLEKWLIGYYYNTPYPNLLGYLALILFIVLQFVIPKNNDKNKFLSRITTGTAIVGIALAYTPFIILPIIYISGLLVKKFVLYLVSQIKASNLKNHLTANSALEKKKALTLTIVSLLIVFFVVSAFIITSNSSTGEGRFWTLLQRIQTNSYFYSGIVLNPGIFMNLTGIWTVIATVASIVSLMKKNRVNLSVFYLMFSIPILVTALFENLFGNITWLLFPGRLFAFLLVFDWIMLATYTGDFLTRTMKPKFEDATSLTLLRVSISLSLITILFLPSLISHLTLEQADNWDWVLGRDVFKNNYALFSWISKNTNSSDLIMVDYSYASKSIGSFSLKNLTYNPFPSTSKDIELDKDSLIVWERPSLLKSFVNKYDVKYIVVDSEAYHKVPPEVGGDNVYTHKLFAVDEYNDMFKDMPFLKLVKQFGSSSLYKVVNDKGNERQPLQYNKTSWSTDPN